MFFILGMCLFGLFGCSSEVTLTLDDDIITPPANTIPSTSRSNLPAELLWLHQNAQSGNEYIIELTGSGNISAQDLSFSGVNNVTIRLVGLDKERVVQLTDNGNLFRVGSGITLIIGNNVTLRGHGRNNSSLIHIAGRGTLIIEAGARILGNTNTGWNSSASGILVNTDGVFEMKGGEISGMGGNMGGVRVADGGYFKMDGGRITGNNASTAGVGVDNGLFVMTGGAISGNASSQGGGGVRMWNGRFEMEGGTISGNTASGNNNGGGVYLSNAVFNMRGGEISGNTAVSGGGVFVASNASINKTGGIIYGYTLGDSRRNTATNGITSNDRGHAVFVSSSPSRRRETTAGYEINLNSGIVGAAGGWE